jgi:flagellar protein FliS
MQVTTASPEKILLMLYDGAISFSRMAQDRMEKRDVGGKGMYVGKALAIVTELMNTLNHDACSAVTRDLQRLYLYVIGELTKANFNDDSTSLGNAINILSHLRDTWTEAILIAKRQA